MCMGAAAVGGSPRHARLAGHDQQHGHHLARAHRLAEGARGHHQQDQQPGRERRLHRGERRQAERRRVQRPAKHGEQHSDPPAPAPHEPAQQAEPERQLSRKHARVERLNGHGHVEQH